MLRTIFTHAVTLTCLGLISVLLPHVLCELFAKLAILGSVLYASFQISSFLDYTLPRSRVSPKGKAVFITGCDTGFGNLLAQRLDREGFKVLAGCLESAGQHAASLKKAASDRLEIVAVDVTQDRSVEEALRTVEKKLGECKLWALVNNAGIIIRGETEWMPLEDYRRQFEINTFGVVRVTKAFLPLLRHHKSRVVTTSSIGGRFTFSGFAPYCMSKFATNSFCAGLRMEMEKFGVKVITIEPFSHKTNMTEMATVLQSATNTWSRRTDTLKAPPYTDGYFEAFKKSVRRFNDSTALPNTSRVVDAMVEAVSADSPHYSYTPGDLRSNLDMWFGKRLPITLANYVVRRTVTFDIEVERYLKKMADKKSR